jgi:hypothetical protein
MIRQGRREDREGKEGEKGPENRQITRYKEERIQYHVQTSQEKEGAKTGEGREERTNTGREYSTV